MEKYTYTEKYTENCTKKYTEKCMKECMNACVAGDIETLTRCIDNITNKNKDKDKDKDKNNNMKSEIDIFLTQCLNIVCEAGYIDLFNVLCQYVKVVETTLHYACKGGDIKMINLVSETCIDVYSYDTRNNHFFYRDGFIKFKEHMWEHSMYGACEGGLLDLVKLFANMSAIVHTDERTKLFWNQCLHHACKSGNLDMIKYTIQKGATDWKNSLQFSCELGNEDIVELMVTHGADNFNTGLSTVCRHGHIKLVEYMINKGATYFGEGLQGACEGGYMDIVNLMMSKGATNFNEGLRSACRGGHVDIVEFMILCGANNISRGLMDACKGGHTEVVRFILNCRNYDTTNTKDIISLNNALDHTMRYSKYNITDIVCLLLAKGANNYSLLKNAKSFIPYKAYCKFSGSDPRNDTQTLCKLQVYPPYVLLVLNIVSRSDNVRKRKTGEKSKNIVTHLPVELIRLVFNYLS